MSRTRNNVKTRRSLTRWAKIAILVAAAVICCVSAYRMGQFVSNWRHSDDTGSLRRADATDLATLAPSLPLAGIWSFDELDWNMRSQWSSEKELPAKLADLAAKITSLADDQLPDADQEFLTLAASLGVKPTERDGQRIYQLSRPGLQSQWITRDVNGTAKSCAFAVAYPTIDGQWQLFEFTPRTKGAAGAESHATHLLPLPADAHRDGGRFADDGRLLLELISLDSSGEQLLATWKQNGWEVHANEFANSADFSFLCRRGDEIIYAWSADPHDSLRNLMLVRTSNVADTGP